MTRLDAAERVAEAAEKLLVEIDRIIPYLPYKRAEKTLRERLIEWRKLRGAGIEQTRLFGEEE